MPAETPTNMTCIIGSPGSASAGLRLHPPVLLARCSTLAVLRAHRARPTAPPPAHPPLSAQLGSMIFKQDLPRDYNFITEAADKDDNVRVPAVATVDTEMRNLLPLTPEWTTWPDYDRVSVQTAAPGRTGGARCVANVLSVIPRSWGACEGSVRGKRGRVGHGRAGLATQAASSRCR